MITAVDTNVLFDLFRTDSPHHFQSKEWLADAYDRGAVIVCDIVYAELVPAFRDRATLDGALREINAVLSPIDTSIAYEAGQRWGRYRRAGGAAGTNHLRLSDWRSRNHCRRRVSYAGPRLLRDVLSGVEKAGRKITASFKLGGLLIAASRQTSPGSDRENDRLEAECTRLSG